MENDRLLENKRAAARILNVSPRTMDNLVAEKRIAVVRIGRRVLFSRADLEAFVKKQTQKAISAQ